MDDQDVTVGAMRDAPADALAEQALENVRLPGTDDDQVGVPLLRHLDDGLGRLADGGYELRLEVAPGEGLRRELELRAALLGCGGGIRRPHGAGDPRQDARPAR